MRDFSSAKRIVVKVGTNLLSDKDGVDRNRIRELVDEIAYLRGKGIQVLLVSSGAVGLGAKALGHESAVKQIALRQACAAIGQPVLMDAYQKEFSRHNIISSQILITRSVLNNRKSYNNLRSAVMTLLELDVVPIFNENDVVSTAEIGNVFGDNDRMSALVASKIDASLLILLTDIDGLYTDNPKTNRDAKKIESLSVIDSSVFAWANGKGSEFSTGGMKTKLMAAQIAQRGGCGTVIASGYEKDILIKIMEGEEKGTYILPDVRMSQRQRWILNTPSEGTIIVDEGAEAALCAHKSLLPSGIVGVKGVFSSGDVVDVKRKDGKVFMKAVSSFNSSEILMIKGHPSKDISTIVGESHKVVFRPEDTVQYE